MGLLITGNGLAGMRQRDLIQWYVNQQNELNSYSSMEEASAELSKIKAIIEVYLSFTSFQEFKILLMGMFSTRYFCFTAELNSKRGSFDSGG